MSEITNRLKKKRISLNFKVNFVVSELEKYGIEVKKQTFYGYENGVSHPSAETVLALCAIYGIPDVLDFFGYTDKKEKKLSYMAVHIASLYDAADKHTQDIVNVTLEYLQNLA